VALLAASAATMRLWPYLKATDRAPSRYVSQHNRQNDRSTAAWRVFSQHRRRNGRPANTISALVSIC
jgi:hypothetical protein